MLIADAYLRQSDVLVVRAEEIEDAWRAVNASKEGYVWIERIVRRQTDGKEKRVWNRGRKPVPTMPHGLRPSSESFRRRRGLNNGH